VGDYRLDKLLTEGEGFQDWEPATSASTRAPPRAHLHRGQRLQPRGTPTRVRQARREFEMLEGIDHPGILKVKDYKETELGPALIFDHDPKAVRLDHLLRDHGKALSPPSACSWCATLPRR
jgi:hypothetical protein